MKNKQMIVMVDDEFLEKVDYIERINGYKNKSDCVRRTIEKEYRKEQFPCGCCMCYEDRKCIILETEVESRTRDERCPLGKENNND